MHATLSSSDFSDNHSKKLPANCFINESFREKSAHNEFERQQQQKWEKEYEFKIIKNKITSTKNGAAMCDKRLSAVRPK